MGLIAKLTRRNVIRMSGLAHIIATSKLPPKAENAAVRAAVYANDLDDIPNATRELRTGLAQGNRWNIMRPLRPLRSNRADRLPEEIRQDPEWLGVWADPKLHDLITAYRANIIAFRKGG